MTQAPPITGTQGSTHCTVPASACSWAVLREAPGDLPMNTGPRSRPLLTVDEARTLLEAWLPMPIDEAHWALHPATTIEGSEAIVACAVPASALAPLLQGGCLSVTPDAVPACVADQLASTVSPHAFNLLVGAFEPPPVRRLRRQTTMLGCLAGGLAVALLLIGIDRRITMVSAHAEAAREATRSTLAGVVPAAPGAPEGPIAAAARARVERARLQRVASESAQRLAGPDRSALLADLLGCWPKEASKDGLFVTTQAIQVGATGVTVTATVGAEADVRPLAAALGALPGWTLQQSQRSIIGGSAGRARVVLRLVPARREPRPTGPVAPAREEPS